MSQNSNECVEDKSTASTFLDYGSLRSHNENFLPSSVCNFGNNVCKQP